ncbi:unnamed protein product [Phytophthora lilii]|uniref:Unnamed protein product n=1 Tax=Phytophthora lilii TaxID=2077276 RepID=A0A9W6UCU6_9STRA|nr:unnamed protein product [Phytophthora lilii]
MAQGLDSSLLYCYASLMALNAFVAFYDIQFRWNDSTLHHILKDSMHKLTGAKSNSNSVASVNAADIAVKTDLHAGRSVVHQRLRQMVGIFFLIYGIGCIVYTIFAVQNSQASCSSYPQCAQFAYQWILGASNEACGCIAYVDRELAPADSTDLVDVSQTLAELASAGKLQTVQLVNRRLNGSLPDELQACERLRNL